MSFLKRNKLLTPAFNLFNKSRFNYAHKLAESIESEKQELFLDKENCILVDENDKNIGFASKRDCHKVDNNRIRLHRAFSVFLFNKNGDMLLQKRSSHKVSLSGIFTLKALKNANHLRLCATRDTKVVTFTVFIQNLHKICIIFIESSPNLVFFFCLADHVSQLLHKRLLFSPLARYC